MSAPQRSAASELVRRKLSRDLHEAQALILKGAVHTSDRKIQKPGELVGEDEPLTVKGGSSYSSRGALKLAYAHKVFRLDFADKTVVDIGSSTGGFASYALAHGARKVYCVDVGRNLLDYKLRHDPRVVVMEGTHFRDLKTSSFAEKIDLALCDVSFTSCIGALAAMVGFAEQAMVLVKPQFEASREEMAGTGGLAPMEVRWRVLRSVRDAGLKLGWFMDDYSACPVVGKSKRNVEWVTLWKRS